ncbi:MAG: metalloprotease family protein [Treponema sp.]|nr:metalloprotease family protein [Treponema sp.]
MIKETINEDNYIKEKMSINIVWANIFAFIVILKSVIIFGIPYYIIWNYKGADAFTYTLFHENTILRFFIILILFIISIFLHEIIHGIFFAVNSENKFKSIKYGIMPKEKLFSPYCHCVEILKINHYRFAVIMPTIILGIIPIIVSLIIGHFLVFIFGVVFIAAGSGDILMLLKMKKLKNNVLIYDLPDEAGFIVYKPK